MKVREITSVIEAFAPLSLQESYDNAGLIVGREDDEVHKALLAVDVTEEVLAEAVAEGCDMVITHHPIVFHAMKRFNSASVTERCVEEAIRRGIVLYAAHTNLDSTPQGMSWRVAQMLNLQDVEVLQPTNDAGAGFGVTGELAEAVESEVFMREVMSQFGVRALRHSDIVKPKVRKVAICTGAGGSLIDEARRSGADIYLTGEARYHDLFNYDGRMVVAVIGHYESEQYTMDIFYEIISSRYPGLKIIKTSVNTNPVSYL